jgi:geranylgeranyl diphosphate synthase type II
MNTDEFDTFLNLFLKDNPEYIDVFKGGKRLRPILVMDVADNIVPTWRSTQETAYKIRSFALILELIHCTSLIIDDLPTMDNDTYRRGELTFHAKHGRQAAYIMVYNLLSLIKKIIWKNDDNTEEYIDFEELVNTELTNLVLGQKYDLDDEWKPNPKEQVSRTLKIAELKTASLFKLAFLGPFYLLKPNNSKITVEVLSRISLNLGMAFQLSDDYLDIDNGVDNEKNNYGLETSIESLENKYIDYTILILKDLQDTNWNDESVIYKIIDLMNTRFERKKKKEKIT